MNRNKYSEPLWHFHTPEFMLMTRRVICRKTYWHGRGNDIFCVDFSQGCARLQYGHSPAKIRGEERPVVLLRSPLQTKSTLYSELRLRPWHQKRAPFVTGSVSAAKVLLRRPRAPPLCFFFVLFPLLSTALSAPRLSLCRLGRLGEKSEKKRRMRRARRTASSSSQKYPDGYRVSATISLACAWDIIISRSLWNVRLRNLLWLLSVPQRLRSRRRTLTKWRTFFLLLFFFLPCVLQSQNNNKNPLFLYFLFFYA